MTVPTTEAPQSFPSDGVSDVFTFTFKAIDPEDVLVTFEDEDGVETTIDPSDYTITLATDGVGGRVQFDDAPEDNGTVTIASNRPYSQRADIKNHGRFRLDQIEEAIDSCVVLIKQLRAGAAQIIETTGIPLGTVLKATSPILVDGAASADLADEPTITFDPSAVKLDDFGVPDDNTDLNASATKHGLLPKRPNTLATGKVFRGDGTYVEDLVTLTVGFDNNGDELEGPLVVDKEVPFNCTILSATLLADDVGDVAVAIWKDTYANFPPTIGDSIVAAAPPTLSGAEKSQDSTLTGWTTSVSAGDILRFTFDGFAAITRVQLSLKVRRTT